VPVVYHGNRRVEALDVEAVALPLHRLYSRSSGRLRFKTRAEIAEAFRISKDTRILLVGCGRDKPIEAWWGLSTVRAQVIAALKDLGIELVTSPNYSLFTDQPRYDDMFNIKRIHIAWQEFLANELPSALHLNARTQHDYVRLTRFIGQRDEVTDVAFEFGTGAAWPTRREFHQVHLNQLARQVRRSMRLIMIGGLPSIPVLAPSFDHITYFDTSAFMNAIHRQHLIENDDGRLIKRQELTELGAPVDGLFSGNIDAMRRRVEKLISGSRQRRPQGDTVPMLESPESAPSGPTAPSSPLVVVR
jgi:hypothetical protein